MIKYKLEIDKDYEIVIRGQTILTPLKSKELIWMNKMIVVLKFMNGMNQLTTILS
jgi:hypothetical protein